jgi:hypothetical protein
LPLWLKIDFFYFKRKQIPRALYIYFGGDVLPWCVVCLYLSPFSY